MGSVGSASFVGIPGLTIAVTSVGIVVIKKASDNTVVDYSQTCGRNIGNFSTVAVAPSDTPSPSFRIDDNNGDYIQVAGNATIDLFGFVSVTGGFGIEKKTNQSVVVLRLRHTH